MLAIGTALAVIFGCSQARAFTTSDPNPQVGETVTFTATDPLTCMVNTCTWTFGDGTADALGASVNHAFAAAGTFQVTLTVRQLLPPNDVVGAPESALVTVTAPPPVPTSVQITTNGPAQELVNVPRVFSMVVAPSDLAVTRSWTINGGAQPETGATLTRAFASPGTYAIGGSASANGGTQSGSLTFTVPNRPPVASFTYSPQALNKGDRVTLTSNSSDPDGQAVTDEEWDLDNDGSFDDGDGPTVTTTAPDRDSWVVRLRVRDSVSFQSQPRPVVSQTITLRDRPSTFSSDTPVPTSPGAAVDSKILLRQLLSPFPTVRFAGRLTRRGARVTLFRVKAPSGARISARCRKGCPRKRLAKAAAARNVSLRGLRGTYRAGAVLEISITKADMVGKYTRITFRRGKAPRRADSCLDPDSGKPTTCPPSQPA